MQMKKKSVLLIVLVLAISHAIVFAIGSMIGSKITHEKGAQAVEEASAHASLAHYSTYRDIALDIKAGRYIDATCRAEMMATSMFAGLERCTENEQCKDGLRKNARQLAPEILEGTPIPIEKRDSCSRQNK
jgi:hypothetical protein